MGENLKNISIFDADACIMMGKPLSDGYSQISELILYFDDSYIHEMVYREIRSHIQKTHLNDLINQGLMSIVDDRMILEFLVSEIKDEEIACNFFISSMINNLSYMEEDERERINTIYNSVINNQYNSIESLLLDLSNIESSIGSDTNCGEFKTSILIEVFNFLELAEVNYFVSNDKGARGSIVRQYGESINTISPIATFILFKQINCIDMHKARLYLNNIGTRGANERIGVIDDDGNFVTKTYLEIFNDIYDDSIDMSVSIDGYIIYS